MGLLSDQFGGDESGREKYAERIIGDDYQNCAIITTTNYDGQLSRGTKPMFFRLASSQKTVNSVIDNLVHLKGISGFIVDEDFEGSTEQLELSISQLDRSLREVNMRSEFSLLAEGERVRGI